MRAEHQFWPRQGLRVLVTGVNEYIEERRGGWWVQLDFIGLYNNPRYLCNFSISEHFIYVNFFSVYHSPLLRQQELHFPYRDINYAALRILSRDLGIEAAPQLVLSKI